METWKDDYRLYKESDNVHTRKTKRDKEKLNLLEEEDPDQKTSGMRHRLQGERERSQNGCWSSTEKTERKERTMRKKQRQTAWTIVCLWDTNKQRV